MPVGHQAASVVLHTVQATAGVVPCHKSSMNGTSRQSLHCFSTSQQREPNISKLSPLLQRQWDHAKNAHLGDILVTAYSNRKVWWSCDQCPQRCKHEWAASVHNRSSGSACPFCANRAVCQHKSLATKAPAIAAQFSSKNQSSAHDYLCKSHKHVLWQCEHGHEWRAALFSRTNLNAGCPECFSIKCSSQPRQRHPTLTDSQHAMMMHWDWELNDQAGFDPSKITCRSDKRPHWICHQCPQGWPHRWQARVSQMYEGTGCPCCAGRQACTCNSLLTHNPEVAAEWNHSRNKGTAADYTARTNARVWWYNARRGLFFAAVSDRTRVYSRKAAPLSTA